jgi:hypothetical protein
MNQALLIINYLLITAHGKLTLVELRGRGVAENSRKAAKLSSVRHFFLGFYACDEIYISCRNVCNVTLPQAVVAVPLWIHCVLSTVHVNVLYICGFFTFDYSN